MTCADINQNIQPKGMLAGLMQFLVDFYFTSLTFTKVADFSEIQRKSNCTQPHGIYLLIEL